MDENTTTFGLGQKQIQQLFSIGANDTAVREVTGSNESKADMLHRRLRETLPLSRDQLGALPAALSKLCNTIGSIAGETIIALLKNSDTDISLLQRIKRYGKRLSNHALSQDEQHVGVAIYYGAIASALVYHNRRISRLSYAKLSDSFHRLCSESWVSSDLNMLYRIAMKYCGDRSHGPTS